MGGSHSMESLCGAPYVKTFFLKFFVLYTYNIIYINILTSLSHDKLYYIRFSSILEEISKRPTAQVFLRPVPKSIVPGYHDIITNPIDLSTIKDRCTNQYKYRDCKSFLSELELMARNAAQFNGPEHVIAMEAKEILTFAQETVIQYTSIYI